MGRKVSKTRAEAGSTETPAEETEESKDTTEQDVPVQGLDEENEGDSPGKGYCWL